MYILCRFIARIDSFDVMNLKSIYYQIYSNPNAYRVQNESECVVSQFSVPTQESSIGFLFQGMKNHTILKMYGDVEFSQKRFLLDEDHISICFHMNVSSFPARKKEICFLDYDPKLNWILIGDPQLRLLHGMVHNRSCVNDVRHMNESIRKYEQNNIITYDMNCKYFDPPGLG